jgi:adenine/guanine phosphoribosyltransferase-like PRPP-binding protein
VNIGFRKVSNPEAFKKTVAFLTDDVIRNGGSASEIVNMHGTLVQITVCKVPWGTLLMRSDVSRLEAIAWLNQDPE